MLKYRQINNPRSTFRGECQGNPMTIFGSKGRIKIKFIREPEDKRFFDYPSIIPAIL